MCAFTCAPGSAVNVVIMTAPLRLAVAQTIVPEDPTDPGVLRESGAQVRALMREAAAAGAHLAQFPEGAITYPGKRVMSSAGPGRVAEADWSRVDWGVMHEQAGQVAALAGELGIWTVFGSLHPLTPPRRPHNSLYVITPQGTLLTRYDKRYLSNTEISWMYTPGTEPVTFAARGLTFGCAICIEACFPEVFAAYEQMDVGCMLVSAMVQDAIRPVIAQAYAALHGYWVGYSAAAQHSHIARAGIIAPGGRWLARCPSYALPSREADRSRAPGLDLENGRGLDGSHVHELAPHPHSSHVHGSVCSCDVSAVQCACVRQALRFIWPHF
jgi:predicted amidohydrolase